MDRSVEMNAHQAVERPGCPVCGSERIQTSIETDEFAYGAGPEAPQLRVQVTVKTCLDCGFQFTDDQAEDTRHEAVCRHLGVLAPREVRELRKRHGLSRAEFARLTRIGEASLARWESGSLIQNGAHDQFLRLLFFPENLERLREALKQAGWRPLQTGVLESRPLSRRSSCRPRFRHLSNVDRAREQAASFVLRPMGGAARRRELCTP